MSCRGRPAIWLLETGQDRSTRPLDPTRLEKRKRYKGDPTISARLHLMVATQQTLSSLLQRFNTEQKVRGSAVVTRDGLPLVSALPASVNRETFAAMTATMVGAAETAAGEVDTTVASSVTAEFGRLRLVAVDAGPELLVVAILDGADDADAPVPLSGPMRDLADQVRKAL